MIDKISLYRSFYTVAKCSGISPAAKELYVTQPAVSADIISLENTLGVKLFFRTNRGMKLTPEGEVLYGYIKSAFAFIDSGEDALRAITGLKNGRIRIGASDMTLKFYLLDYIQPFLVRYPQIKLSITNNPTPKTLDEIRNGNIDFGVISDASGKYSKDDDEFVKIPVKRINDIFVCSPDCPLAHETNVTPDRIAEFNVIMLEKNTSTRAYLKTQKGFDRLEADIELATSELIIEFAKRGMGVAAVMSDFASEAIERGELCKIDLACPPEPRNFLLVYLRRLPLPAAAGTLVTEMLESSAI